MADKIFKAVSLAICSSCNVPGFGAVCIDKFNINKPELDLWAPVGWVELPDEIICEECYTSRSYNELKARAMFYK